MKTPWHMRAALSATVSLAALSAAPALAQSNQELLAEIRALNDRLQQLESQVAKNTEVANEAVEASHGSLDNIVSGGKTGVRISLSGQVNRGLLFYDDGETQETRHVDNDHSSTRVRVLGEGDIDEDLTVGTNIEVQFESNSSAAVSQLDDRQPQGPNNFTERKLELYVDSDTYGRLTIGQGDTASNGTSEVDLSGTSVVGYSGQQDLAGSVIFRNSATGSLDSAGNPDGSVDTALLNPDIGAAFSNFDGLSRTDRVRYDTPKFAGFSASTSFAEADQWDVALRYGGSFSDVKVQGAVAYASRQDSSEDDVSQYNGSVSALHVPTGVSLTLAAGAQDRDARDPFFIYGKLGYQANWFDFGKTAFSIDGYAGEDMVESGDESTSYGFQIVQNVDRVGTEFYLGGRVYDYEGDEEDFDDVTAVLGGARVKF